MSTEQDQYKRMILVGLRRILDIYFDKDRDVQMFKFPPLDSTYQETCDDIFLPKVEFKTIHNVVHVLS